MILLLSKEQANRNASEVKILSQFVFQEALIRLLNVLRQVAKECKRWRRGIYLGDVLDLDVFSFDRRRWIVNYLG